MKALSLTQPYATAIAVGVKRYETRSWSTKYRGSLAIHAAKGYPAWARDFAMTEATLDRLPSRIPRGAIVATCVLVDCIPAEEAELVIGPVEKLYGDYSPGRWAWRLENVVALLDPIPARGRLGLWEWKPVEPVTFPLAHGLPASMGRMLSETQRLAEVEVAEGFIRAYREVAGRTGVVDEAAVISKAAWDGLKVFEKRGY